MRARGLTSRLALAACACAWAVAAGPGTARGDDPLARAMGLTKDTGSLPVWAKPTAREAEGLTAFARQAREGILLVGDDKVGHGTAFVISRKARLLATNAHVADIFHEAGARQIAIRNETNVIYQVAKVWYHPGALRIVFRDQKGHGTIEQSQDPRAGEIYAACPDVAVLQLAPGPDLPVEFAMATPEEIRDVFAMPVGMMGYPGYDTTKVPEVGEVAGATFTQGIISRVTDFELKPGRPWTELQHLHHSMANWGGFSGSPIFLANGHVVGLHNSAAKKASSGGEVRSLPRGVRVDCLWELLAFHGLDEGIDGVALPIDKGQLLLERYRKPRASTLELHAAINLVRRADRLKDIQDFDGALKKCGEAIRRYPDYPRSYLIRAQVHTEVVAFKKDQLPQAQILARLRSADDDISLYNEKAPSDPEGFIEKSHVLRFRSLFEGDPGKAKFNSEAVAIIEKVLQIQKEIRVYDRGCAFSLASDLSTDPKQKLGFANEALKLYPYDKNCYLNRSYAFQANGRTADAQRDMARFRELLDAEQASDRAWKLATGSLAAMRDGPEAIRIARRSCQVTEWKHWRDLDVLAAAFAEAGDFDKAIECAERATSLAQSERRPEAYQHLQVYRARQPFRDEAADDSY